MILCHCCNAEIFGCTGSLSWPDGKPFQGPPEFHCPHCTEKHFQLGGPCHTHRDWSLMQ